MSSPAMPFRLTLRALFACFLILTFTPKGFSASSSTVAAAPPPTRAAATSSPVTAATAASRTLSSTVAASVAASAAASASTPPDVLLNVPNLSVGRIELDVENLQADINLNANVASLVSINAGVAVSIQKVNLTIVDVQAQLELIVRLGHLVDIVNRVFESLDANPSLISSVLNNVTSGVTNALGSVVGAVDGLLGTITQGGTTLSFVVDNLGNIVQQVGGASGNPVSTIVGNYLTNMTATGATQTLQNGLVQKTYSYTPLNALVNIVTNSAGQVVQATVAKQTGSSTASSSTSSSVGGNSTST
ncbi:hypothetical protein B0A49_04430 [Cryomyces minteri]|uniref:Uncharacterized protein n=1 Tax=Cryomyces minteri TaxID=331657 RepID=A0A4U0XWF7_9PEZI|nr:hypothetical protein B0A49_04430 [Cryomyces minteri]